MLWTVRPWYDAMLPRAGKGCGCGDEEGVSWDDCGAGASAGIDSETGEQRADAVTAKIAVSPSAARGVSNAVLKRKPAPQRRGGRLSGSMNGSQAMLYWARETERHL
jgi:hypothetical protein